MAMTDSVRVLGAVIAGGLSRRMGRQDKLWLEFQGETLLARASRRLARQTGDVILNVNRPDGRIGRIGLPVAPDLDPGNQGPLAGVVAALEWARQNRTDATHLVTASVDSPFYPDDLAALLSEGARDRPMEIAIAFSEGYPQPVFGLWPLSCLPPLRAFLAEADHFKVMAFVRAQPWRRVDFPASVPPPFFNINTPDDLTAARRFVEREAAGE